MCTVSSTVVFFVAHSDLIFAFLDPQDHAEADVLPQLLLHVEADAEVLLLPHHRKSITTSDSTVLSLTIIHF